jgi:hypothetical protein
MRTIAHHHFDHTLNHGPFFFCLTDGHASNILVDKDEKIAYMLELGYGAFLPADFVIQTPSWLTNQAVDVIDTALFESRRTEFKDIFQEEEKKC